MPPRRQRPLAEQLEDARIDLARAAAAVERWQRRLRRGTTFLRKCAQRQKRLSAKVAALEAQQRAPRRPPAGARRAIDLSREG